MDGLPAPPMPISFMSERFSGLLAVVVLASVAAVAGQAVSAPAGPRRTSPGVTFKVEVNYVEVDASVFDRQGQFVSGLKREDFEIYEDGVQQDISAFTQVNLPIEKPEPLPLQATKAIPPDVVTNARPFDGRVYVIILDDKQTAALRTPAGEEGGRAVHQQLHGEQRHRRHRARPAGR